MRTRAIPALGDLEEVHRVAILLDRFMVNSVGGPGGVHDITPSERAPETSGTRMKLIVRRLRGIVSIGLTWSVVWALGGLSYVAVRLYIDRPAVDVSILMRLAVIGGVIYGVYGFTTGALFTSALAMAERRRTLEQLRMIRIAGWGGIAGAVLPVLILVLSFALEGSAAPVLWSLGFVGFGAALGAASAAVTLGAARSKQPQLEAPGT